jgi:hypothetical protein
MKLVPFTLPLCALALACSKAPEPSTTAPAAAPAPAPVASITPPTAPPFEGEIVVAVKDEASKMLPASITYDVKGNKVRYTPTAAPVHAVSDLDAQRVYAVDDAKKAYDSIDVKAAPAAAQANVKTAAATPQVQRTGKMEKVAGLDCEDWTIRDRTEKVDVCASKGIPYFDLASNAKAGNAEPTWATTLTAARAFPLRLVVHDMSGKEEYRAEATRAERKTIDPAIFNLPTGYKQTDLASETRTASLP